MSINQSQSVNQWEYVSESVSINQSESVNVNQSESVCIHQSQSIDQYKSAPMVSGDRQVNVDKIIFTPYYSMSEEEPYIKSWESAGKWIETYKINLKRKIYLLHAKIYLLTICTLKSIIKHAIYSTLNRNRQRFIITILAFCTLLFHQLFAHKLNRDSHLMLELGILHSLPC